MSTLTPSILANAMKAKLKINKLVILAVVFFILSTVGNQVYAQLNIGIHDRVLVITTGIAKAADEGTQFCLENCDAGEIIICDFDKKPVMMGGSGWAFVNRGDRIRGGAFRHGGGMAYTSTVTVPGSSASRTMSTFKAGSKCEPCFISPKFEFYAPLELSYVQNIDNGLQFVFDEGTNVCVPGESTDILKFVLASGKKYHNSNNYLLVEDASGNQINKVLMTTDNCNFSHNEITGGKKLYGFENPIFFRTSTKFNVSSFDDFNELRSPANRRIGPFYFFEQISGINGSIKAKRIACKPYVEFTVPLTSSTIKDANEYAYRVLPPGEEETSIPAELIVTNPNISNNVILRPQLSDASSFEPVGSYKFQIFQKSQLEEDLSYEDVKCAYEVSLYLGGLPDPYNISASAKVLYTYGSNKYHIKKYGLNNATATIKIEGESNADIRHFEYSYNNSNWYNIPSSSIKNEGEYSYLYSGLSPRRYHVRLEDKDGCHSNSVDLGTLKQPGELLFKSTTIGSVLLCHPNNSDTKKGSITSEFKGGIPPYSIYLKSSPKDSTTLVEGTTITKDNYPDHAPGTYSIVVYDQANVSDSRQVVISHPDEITLTHDVTPPECPDDLGIVTLRQSNGVQPFDYEMETQAVKNDINSNECSFSVPGNTYWGKVTDNRGCYATDNSIYFDDVPEININAIGSKIAEYGGNTGTITVNVDGGTPDYTCEVWKGSSKEGSADGGKLEDIMINNLVEGNYEVRVYDKHFCPASKSDVSVEQPLAALSIGIEYENPTTCNGYNDGSFKVTSSGGWEPHEYMFRTGVPQDSPEFTGQEATSGVEYVTVIDGMGITRKHQVTINQPQSISASLSSSKKLDCYQDNSGTATLNISGGNGGYQIYNNEAWTTDLKATGLSAESQYIQIKDKLECTGSVLVDLEEPAPLKASINSIDSVSCFEGNTGAVHLTGSGGNDDGGYFVSTDKSSWETGTDIENLSAGEYTFYMRDEKNCMDSIVNTIPQPVALQINPTAYHLKCFNDNSGAIQMNTDGGNGSYSVSLDNIKWNDGDSLGQLPTLTNHTIYVKDWKNCLTTREINISQPPLLNASTDTIEHILCYGDATGSIRMNINGGTPNYEVSSDSVHWMKGKYLENLSANDNLKVYVRDMNECVAVHSDIIQQPEFPLATNIQSEYHLRCHRDNSGAIKLNINGGTFPYRVSSDNSQWTPGDSLALLPAGMTDIYVLDKNNCQSYEATTLTEPEALSFRIDTVMEAWCDQSNATIDITVTGGTVSNDYSYEWQYIDSNQYFVAKDLLENIYSGLYAVGITDDNSCYVTDTIAVSEQDGPKLNAWHIDSTTCYGKADGVVYIDSVSGGFGAYTYTLNGQLVGSEIINLPAGNHLFKVTDENNCAENRILEIPQPAPFNFNEEILQPTCFGNTDGSIKIAPAGGSGVIDASWDNGQNGYHLTNTGEGMYNVQLKDAHNCIAEKTFEIKQPEPLTITARIDAVLCAGSNDGMIAANALGGNGDYSFQWEGGSNANTLSQLKSDTYHLKVTDMKNCELDTSFFVPSPQPLTINETIINPACFGDANGSISATFEGGTGTIQHWWSTGSTATSIDGLPQGSYSVNLRDKNNCTSSKNFTLQHPQPLNISEELHNPVCNDDNNGFIYTQVSGGNGEYTFLWDNGTETADANKLTSGEHILTVSDLKNCTLTKSFILTQPNPVLINGSITPPVCYNSTDGKIEVTAQGGHGEYNYEWSNLVNQSIITGLGEGNYTVTATDKEGCTGSTTFEIIPPAPPTANLDQYPGVLCTGNTIELDGGEFIDYKWYKDGMPYAVTRYLTVGETGTYLLEAKTDLGCMASDTFKLKVSDNPLDATIILPDSAVINDTVRVLDVTWPVPDSIQWFYSLPVEVIDSNYWSEKFTAEESGLMHVTLRAWYGGCFSDSSKTIYIYEDENHIFKSADGSQPLISEYIVYPNPNDGRFTLDVLLSREADIRLTLIQPNTGSKIAEKMDYGLSRYSIPYNLTGLRAGVYLIIISAEKEQVTLKISIAN